MKAFLIACSVAFGIALVPASASTATRNYDCSKPGNANKAVCKGAAKAAAKTEKATAAKSTTETKTPTKGTSTKVSSTTVTQTAVQRNYDCTKPGNKNKAACRSATPSKPVVTQTNVTKTIRQYDCSKPGNANKQQCKVSTATQQASSRPVALPKPAPRTTRPSAVNSEEALNHSPVGAIAVCKDSTYSHAKAHTGACSRHGGVAKWLG